MPAFLRTSRIRRRALAAAGAALTALLLAGCASPTPQPTTSSQSASGTPSFILITNEPIGKSAYWKRGKTGIAAAAKQFEGTSKVYESNDETRESNLEAAIAAAPAVIVMVGHDFSPLASQAAVDHAAQKFLLIDGGPLADAPKNLYQANFREAEAAYLLGAEAALLTDAKQLAVLSADDQLGSTSAATAYAEGFSEGVSASAPGAVIHTLPLSLSDDPKILPWVGATPDPATPTDAVLALGSQALTAVLEAEEGLKAAARPAVFGTNIENCAVLTGELVDSAIKAIDVVIVTLITQIMDGATSAEATASFGFAEQGMTLASMQRADEVPQCTVLKDEKVFAEIVRMRTDIVNGTLVVSAAGADGESSGS